MEARSDADLGVETSNSGVRLHVRPQPSLDRLRKIVLHHEVSRDRMGSRTLSASTQSEEQEKNGRGRLPRPKATPVVTGQGHDDFMASTINPFQSERRLLST